MGYQHLRAQHFYRDLRSGRGTLHQVHARDWRRLLDALSPQAIVAKQPLGMWLTVGAQILEVGSQKITCKADVPRIPPSHAPQWIRMADPQKQEIHTFAMRADLHCAGCPRVLLTTSFAQSGRLRAIALPCRSGRNGRRIHSRRRWLD